MDSRPDEGDAANSVGTLFVGCVPDFAHCGCSRAASGFGEGINQGRGDAFPVILAGCFDHRAWSFAEALGKLVVRLKSAL